jgi:pimeloyl-ACP methyl ester carboxylesterase
VITTEDVGFCLAAPAPARGWLSRWTTVDGLRIHERVPAVAPETLPVVLLHGLAVSHRYLMPTADPLAVHHPVVVPDLPGFGLSDKPPTALDVTGHAAVLSAWLDARGLDRVCVLGHSFGAEIAARLARLRPDVVAALVLAGSTADPAARTRRQQVARWTADLHVEDPRQGAILVRDVRDAGPSRVWATLGHSVHNAVEEDLCDVGVPTLVLGGAWDPVAPPRWRRQMAALTGGRVVVVPRSGHNVLTTAGSPSAAAIAAHLAAVGLIRSGDG